MIASLVVEGAAAKRDGALRRVRWSEQHDVGLSDTLARRGKRRIGALDEDRVVERHDLEAVPAEARGELEAMDRLALARRPGALPRASDGAPKLRCSAGRARAVEVVHDPLRVRERVRSLDESLACARLNTVVPAELVHEEKELEVGGILRHLEQDELRRRAVYLGGEREERAGRLERLRLVRDEQLGAMSRRRSGDDDVIGRPERRERLDAPQGLIASPRVGHALWRLSRPFLPAPL